MELICKLKINLSKGFNCIRHYHYKPIAYNNIVGKVMNMEFGKLLHMLNNIPHFYQLKKTTSSYTWHLGIQYILFKKNLSAYPKSGIFSHFSLFRFINLYIMVKPCFWLFWALKSICFCVAFRTLC